MTGRHSAVYFGVKLTVKQLLEKGAVIEVANRDGETLLYKASSNEHVDVVKLLLEKGTDIAAADL